METKYQVIVGKIYYTRCYTSKFFDTKEEAYECLNNGAEGFTKTEKTKDGIFGNVYKVKGFKTTRGFDWQTKEELDIKKRIYFKL